MVETNHGKMDTKYISHQRDYKAVFPSPLSWFPWKSADVRRDPEYSKGRCQKLVYGEQAGCQHREQECPKQGPEDGNGKVSVRKTHGQS